MLDNLNTIVPCLPLIMIVFAFHISHCLYTKKNAGSEKTNFIFIQTFYNPNTSIWIKHLCTNCITCQLIKLYHHSKQLARKQDFEGQSLYFNHSNSFDTKGPISPTSKGNLYMMVIVDAFTH